MRRAPRRLGNTLTLRHLSPLWTRARTGRPAEPSGFHWNITVLCRVTLRCSLDSRLAFCRSPPRRPARCATVVHLNGTSLSSDGSSKICCTGRTPLREAMQSSHSLDVAGGRWMLASRASVRASNTHTRSRNMRLGRYGWRGLLCMPMARAPLHADPSIHHTQDGRSPTSRTSPTACPNAAISPSSPTTSSRSTSPTSSRSSSAPARPPGW